MERTILLQGGIVSYTLRQSARAKHLRLTVSSHGGLRVSCPKRVSFRAIEIFLRQKESWIAHARARRARERVFPSFRAEGRELYREYARVFVERKIKEFNAYYGFSYNRIAIKDLKSQWGSCSEKKNLNFAYKLIFLPPRLAEYVIVHELCHLSQMNHSSQFWRLVHRAIPEYAQLEKELSVFHLS